MRTRVGGENSEVKGFIYSVAAPNKKWAHRAPASLRLPQSQASLSRTPKIPGSKTILLSQ